MFNFTKMATVEIFDITSDKSQVLEMRTRSFFKIYN
jgi:hypothetical protein